MKAAVLENNKFVIKNIPAPILDEYVQGAIIRVEGCGLCGSDIVKLQQNLVPDGSVLGHEVVGEIVEINSNTPFVKGDRVVLGHHIPCFACQYCHGGNYSMCRHFKSTNIVPGGFAEYIYVTEEHLNNTVFYANLSLSSVEASFTEPLACCIRAVKRAQIIDNSKNLIVGLGSIGILMGEAVKAFGYEVYGCDLISQRAEISEQYGFNKSFVLKNEEDTLKEMKKYAPIGFDTVFLTAGASSALDFAVKAARDGAKIIVFSSVKSDNGFKNNDIYYRELTVTGSYSSSPVDLEDSVSLLEEHRVNVLGLSKTYKLENINEALNDTISNKIMKAYIEI
ncbi:alcohol dehydrogenase catalytic domain-containing protein [bacterium]|nr:alcohol dehydrogenase catalytic domain-containing protein [bacterium]